MRPCRKALAPVFLILALCGAATTAGAVETVPQPLAAAGAAATGFPAPGRPVAHIVSPRWGDFADRDKAGEVMQIVRRLRLKAGMTVADIGAGDGYDTLRLAKVVGPRGRIIAEDVTAPYLETLARRAREQGLRNVTTALGDPQDARLPPRSADAAIMVHMYHEITQPYVLLYNLAASLKPGARVGVEELDRTTASHGTPAALLVCEFEAVGYRKTQLSPLPDGLGYFAVFTPPAPDQRPAPQSIKPCKE